MERNRFRSLSSSTQVKGKALKRAGSVMLAVLAAGLFSVSGAQAAFVYSGDVTPDPATWISTTTAYVGNTSTGTVTLNNGSNSTTRIVIVANSLTGNGKVTVDGTGTAWSTRLLVGYNGGTGIVSITNGGKVSSTDSNGDNIGYKGGTGTVIIDGPGSTLSDYKLTICTNAAGYSDKGTLSITNGGAYSGKYVSVAVDGTDTGLVKVDGKGSTLTVDNYFRTSNGTGTLYVTNGASASVGNLQMGINMDSKNYAVIDGVGSKLSASSYINMGSASYSQRFTDRLSISDGAAVTAASFNMYNSGSVILTTDIGRGSSLTVGGGTGILDNNGTIRLVAGAAADNGTYTPISAGTWSGTGTVQALGGIWDATNHTVTVTSAAAGAAGSALTADLATTQRFLFTDGTGRQAGASFQAATSPTNLTLNAGSLSGGVLASLQGLLGAGQAVLSGWDFNVTEGYTAGDPVYLSLFAGSGHSLYDLNIWHYDGSAWSKVDASDLAYDNNLASFTATGLSGYAVSGTAPVPIPAAAWLLGSGLMGLVGLRRRTRG
ncbi:MAG: VPLPA-CTERM sorting domain-containing protein [Geobacteraceae bacterium]|nr:VPLPA-CTERM sorting domain-containing protein [Geobacteraceae bacterium]